MIERHCLNKAFLVSIPLDEVSIPLEEVSIRSRFALDNSSAEDDLCPVQLAQCRLPLAVPTAVRTLLVQKRICVRSLDVLPLSDWLARVCEFVDGLRQLPIPVIPLVQLLLVDLESDLVDRLPQRSAEAENSVHPWDAAGSDGANELCDRFEDYVAALLRRPGQPMSDLQCCFCIWVDKHIGDHVTVRDIADGLACHPGELTRAVQGLWQCSVRQYVMRRRLEIAFERIQAGEKIEATMVFVGYRNRTSFFRDFRRRFTVLPGEIKRARSQHAAAVSELLGES